MFASLTIMWYSITFLIVIKNCRQKRIYNDGAGRDIGYVVGDTCWMLVGIWMQERKRDIIFQVSWDVIWVYSKKVGSDIIPQLNSLKFPKIFFSANREQTRVNPGNPWKSHGNNQNSGYYCSHFHFICFSWTFFTVVRKIKTKYKNKSMNVQMKQFKVQCL